MPWKKTNPMQEKLRFISDYIDGCFSVTELSNNYGISRKTAYKIINRFEEKGIDGLKEYSRRPLSSPNSTSDEIVREILNIKDKYRSWGPKKVAYYLRRRSPELPCPAISTIGEIFKRNGLVKPRRRARRVPEYNKNLIEATFPNDVWGADYKGHFRMENKEYCYPLTITDSFSRYLIKCKGLAGTRHDPTRDAFEAAFSEYGMPVAIRTDNGVPFAGRTAGGLSRLSLWFIKLGIIPERIEKGKPQQNGIHERFHKTLKAETAVNPRANLKRQQILFEKFRDEYNNDRPHEGINNLTPSDIYRHSGRKYTGKLIEPEYHNFMEVRKVKLSGEIKIKSHGYYITELLAGDYVGIKEVDNGFYEVYYSFHKLAEIDTIKNKIKRT